MIRVTRKTEPHDVIDSLNDELQQFGLELQEVNPGEDESEFELGLLDTQGVRWERLSPALIRAEIGAFEALVYDSGRWFVHDSSGTVANGREVAQSLATRRVIAVVHALSAGP